ncbi:restriction endonuclease subunit S [uncultured Corynebacterium sp.]|jgi:restriction modification system DNA specificity domain protein|uniref:restriction endonuclease subunit S n=1 Tax=uncultured Corynebacterium sp. TaxID=159447 RepID=UPI0028D7C8A1|nr:restriction endonuclease subunit S [uncultured Corynebacterium sp.]
MNWKTKRLADLITLERGFDLPKAARIPGNVPVISSGKIEGTHNKAKIKGPGFAIGRATNLGLPRWSDIDYWPLNTTLYAKDFHGNNPRWLYYLFMVMDLSGYNSGSVQPMLNRNYISEIPVQVPSIKEQDSIVSCISTLDNKIAANQRTIQSADSLRNALWDKLLKTNTESLPLSSLAEFINGRAFTKNATGTGRVVARIAELNSGIGSNTVFNDIEVHQNHVVLPGELLFAWSGTLMTKRWPYDEAIVNQHIFKVLPISKFDLWALELIIQSQIHYFQMIAAGKATTMGHIKRADLDKTVEVPTSIPDKLNMLGNTLWMLASQAEQENQTLARTRDELLPLLMSGKITVRDAEEASAEVGVDKHEVEE